MDNEVKPMQKCTLYHTGVHNSAHGVIKDNKVYLQGEEDQLYLPEEMFMAREECEGGLIQFELDGKWGFADIYTGEIMIASVWDYAGPFYHGYAHVTLDVQLEIDSYYVTMQGGRHGYINQKGEIVIPLEYDDAEEIPYRKYFMVAKNGKWGIIDIQNKIMIPFQWNHLTESYHHDLIFCGIEENCDLHVGNEDKFLAAIFNTQPEPTCYKTMKWGVYDQNFNLIVEPELDEAPYNPVIKASPRSRSCSAYQEYFILQKVKKYGLLCKDGRLIANVELTKKQAKAMINMICGQSLAGSLYKDAV